MPAEIITFPVHVRQEQEPPHPYDFWYPLLERMPPRRRLETIRAAHRCGVISDFDRETFEASWSDWGQGR